jgi:hypothetical protein
MSPLASMVIGWTPDDEGTFSGFMSTLLVKAERYERKEETNLVRHLYVRRRATYQSDLSLRPPLREDPAGRPG